MTPKGLTIFDDIRIVHQTLTGWATWKKAETIAAIIIATRPKISCEIGVWNGKSLIPAAMAHKYLGIGKIIGIDPWLSGCSVAGQLNPADVRWWGNQDNHTAMYHDFLRRVKDGQLEDFIQIERMHSDEFEPPDGIGYLSVDGNHGVQAIKDFQRYAPKVMLGGYLMADDLKWTGLAVERACGLLPAMGFQEVHRTETPEESWALFQRIKV